METQPWLDTIKGWLGIKRANGFEVSHSTEAEYIFTILPIFITSIVLIYQNDPMRVLFGAEWSFMSAVLSGQIITKSVQTLITHEHLMSQLSPEFVVPQPPSISELAPDPVDETILTLVRTIAFTLCPSLVFVVLNLTSPSLPGPGVSGWLFGGAQWILFIYTSLTFFRTSIKLNSKLSIKNEYYRCLSELAKLNTQITNPTMFPHRKTSASAKGGDIPR